MPNQIIAVVFDGTQDSVAETWTAAPQLAITVGVVPSDGFGAMRPWLTNRWQGGATVNVSERWQGTVYLTLTASSGVSTQPATSPLQTALSHYVLSVNQTQAFASDQTFVVQPYVAPSTTRARVRLRNYDYYSGIAGADIAGVQVGIGTSDGNYGYASPTTWTGVTVPGASDYVSPWVNVVPGSNGRLTVAYTVPSGSTTYECRGGYRNAKNVSGTANVNPIPAGSSSAPYSLPFTVAVEYNMTARPVVVIGDSIVAGYNQYFDRYDLGFTSFAYGLGPDHGYPIDAFGVPNIRLSAYVDPARTDLLAAMDLTGAVAVVEAGVNDLAVITLLSQYQTMVASMVTKLRAAGAARIVWCTITPNTTYSSNDALRQSCNTWMLANYVAQGIDAVCDAATTLQNPANHSVLLPAYDSGDGIHLIVAGAQAYEAALNTTLAALP